MPTDIVDRPWAGEEWKLSEVDMGMVGSMAMGLPWKGRGRGSVCWVGSVSGCWVLPWKGRGRGSFVANRWIGALKKVSLGLAMERKRQRIGLLGLAVERKRQRIDLLERKRQRIGLLGLVVERERQRIVCGKSADRCSEEGVLCWVLPWKGNCSRVELVKEELGGRYW